MSINYSQYVESTNKFPYGFINIYYSNPESGIKKHLSLKNITNNNYKDVISFFLNDYFHFNTINNVKIKTVNGFKTINDLEFKDLNDSIGTIIYINELF